MRKLLLVCLAAASVAVASSAAAPGALAATKTVNITSTGFQPAAITAELGDVIAFHNGDNRMRQPVSDVPFSAPILRPDETWSTPELTREGRFTVTDTQVANQRLTITVTRPAPPTVPSLSASRVQVVFGTAVILTGKVPSGRAGQTVTLRAETLTPAGTRQASTVAQVPSGAGGAFRFSHAPGVYTTYSVVSPGPSGAPATSPGVAVAVAPRVTLSIVRSLSGRRVVFSTSATAATSYAGKSAYVQRRTSAGRWVSIKQVVLKAGPGGTRVTVRLPKGLSQIRVLLPKSQVGTGYVAGLSRTLRIVR